MQPIFITGTGTDVGKTLVSAIVTEALGADYWKPVQAGFAQGTDSLFVTSILSNPASVIHPEVYRLEMPASPHIAAPAENKRITVEEIVRNMPQTGRPLVIEGAGGLMVPLNEKEFMPDLISALQAKVIVVSKNELGSINHSMLTALVLAEKKIPVAGWIFTEEYKSYENDIAAWSGYPVIARIRHLPVISREVIKAEAAQIAGSLKKSL